MALWEDSSHPRADFTVASGSRSSPRGSGCSVKLGWLHGHWRKEAQGDPMAVIPGFPPPAFAPQVCSQSPLPALLRETQRPSLSTIPPQQHHRGSQAGWAGLAAGTGPGGPTSSVAAQTPRPTPARPGSCDSSREPTAQDWSILHPDPGIKSTWSCCWENILLHHPGHTVVTDDGLLLTLAPPWECPWDGS